MPLSTQDIKQLFFKDVATKTIRDPSDVADNFTAADQNAFVNNADNTVGHSDADLLNIVQDIIAGGRAAAMSGDLAVAMAAHPLADVELFDNLIEFAKAHLVAADVDNVVDKILTTPNHPELKQINYKHLTYIVGNVGLDGVKLNLISSIADNKPKVEQAEIDTDILADAVLINLLSLEALGRIAKRTDKSVDLENITIVANAKAREEQAAIDTAILSRDIALIAQMSQVALETIAKRTEQANELNLLFAIANGKARPEQEIIETAILSRDIALIAQMPKVILESIARRTEKTNELDKLVEVATGKPLAEQEAIDTAILAERASLDPSIINGISTANLLTIANRTKERANIERIIAAASHKPIPERAAIYTSILEKHDDLLLASLSNRALVEIAANTEILLEIEKIMSLFKGRPQNEQLILCHVIFDRYIAKPELITAISNENLLMLLKFANTALKLDIIVSISKDRSIQEQKGIDMMIYTADEAVFNALNKASLETLTARVVNSAGLDKIVVALKHNGNRDVQESICKIIFDVAVKNKSLIKDMDQKNIIELIGYASKEHLAYIVSRNTADSSKYDVDVDKAIINNAQTAAAELVQLAKRSQSGDDLDAISLHANSKGNKEVYKAIISNKLTQTATLQHLLTNGHIEHIDNDGLLDIVLHNNAVADDTMLDQIMLLDRVKGDARFNKDKIQLFKLHRQQLDLETKEKPDPKTQPVLFNAYHQAQRTIMGVGVFGERAVITSKEQAELIHKSGKTASVAQNIADPDSAEHLMKVGREAHTSVLKAKLGVNW